MKFIRELNDSSYIRYGYETGRSSWPFYLRMIADAEVTQDFSAHKNKTLCNSASAALNKWLNPRVPDNAFLQTFHARQTDLECKGDLRMVYSYGKGYELNILERWIDKVS